ncbi:MAG: hypothetical protein U1E36_07960 [Rickettsiales bacterium]
MARSASELAGFSIFFGCTAFTEKLFPQELKSLKGFLARTFTSHYIKECDWIADKLKAFEGAEKAQARKTMTPEEKASYYADYLVDYGIKVPVSWLGLLKVQSSLLKRAGLPELSHQENVMAIITDEVPKFGSVLFFNGVIPDKIDQYRHSIANILQSSTGMSRKHADTYAADMLNIGVPNALGVGTSGAYLCYQLMRGKSVTV